MGGLFPLRLEHLSETDRDAVDALPRGPATLPPRRLRRDGFRMHAEYVDRRDWRTEVLQMSVGVRLDRVSAGYGGSFVLGDLSLAVAGQPDGAGGSLRCGKTTVLKVIAGLLAPTTGDVWFGKNG